MKNSIFNFIKSIFGIILFLTMLYVGLFSTQEDQAYIDTKKNNLNIEKHT